MLSLKSPTEMRLTGYSQRSDAVREQLRYTDRKVDYTLRHFKASRRWFLRTHSEDEFNLRVSQLEEERNRNLLFEDEAGLWTYSGLRPLFEKEFDDKPTRLYSMPQAKLIPWASPPIKQPRYYQDNAKKALLEAAQYGPAGVEMGTGLGKTLIIVMLLKELGLPAVIMSPSRNIGEQIYDELVQYFGARYVGYVGDGKKQWGRQFTVGVAASLRNVEPGSEGWYHCQQAKVFIADESHLCPAETLQQVCFGLMKEAPYRFFFSGTQMRGDGLDLVLDAITGPIVYRMTVAEGIDQGFLSRIVFRMCWTDSHVIDRDGNLEDSDDANELTRIHCFYNDELIQKAAEIANKAVTVMERPTVIMVEEFEQFARMIPYLRYDFRFAHGGTNKETKKLIPEQFWKSNPKQLVTDFNEGKFPILIGTSCIATGTDIQRVGALLNLRQGKSEVELKQVVGRCTRLFPGKRDCIYIDFGIKNVPTLKKHALERRKIYKSIYETYAEMEI
jgi:superfamily II DNA or RNA helicase